jgi:hypothetical protein
MARKSRFTEEQITFALGGGGEAEAAGSDLNGDDGRGNVHSIAEITRRARVIEGALLSSMLIPNRRHLAGDFGDPSFVRVSGHASDMYPPAANVQEEQEGSKTPIPHPLHRSDNTTVSCPYRKNRYMVGDMIISHSTQ